MLFPLLNDLTLQFLLTILLILSIIAFLIFQLSTYFKKKPQKEVVITQMKCKPCNYEEKRNFQQGDYVGKKTGKCPECGGEMIIYSIYSELVKGKPKPYVKT